MIRINLLPHREEARKAKRQQFYVMLGLVSVLAIVVVAAVHLVIGSYVDAQESKNNFLTREIGELNKQIAEIKRLKEQTQALLARKQVIESLQLDRAESVHLLNGLARQVPDGVYLKSVKQAGKRVQLVGYALSNARVSTLMRNLDASPNMEKPVLIEIKAADVGRRRVSEFILDVHMKRAPATTEEKKR